MKAIPARKRAGESKTAVKARAVDVSSSIEAAMWPVKLKCLGGVTVNQSDKACFDSRKDVEIAAPTGRTETRKFGALVMLMLA